MAKKKTFEDYIQTIFFVLFVLAIIGWLIWSIYGTFYLPPEQGKTIKFEVTGVLNSENASTLVQIHYECIKYCISHTSDNSEQTECWNQCLSLGKEGCLK